VIGSRHSILLYVRINLMLHQPIIARVSETMSHAG
jgi:hypothetical protein